MKLAHKFYILLIPVLLISTIGNIWLIWYDYNKEATRITEESMRFDLNEAAILAQDPIFQFFFEDFKMGYMNDAKQDIKDIKSVLHEAIQTSLKFKRSPLHSVFYDKSWSILAVVTREVGDQKEFFTKPLPELQSEIFMTSYKDFNTPYSKLIGNNHKIVFPVGIDLNKDGRISPGEVEGFLHSEYLMPLDKFNDMAMSRLKLYIVFAFLQAILMFILMYMISRSATAPLKIFADQVAGVSGKNMDKPFAVDTEVYEVQILQSALNMMQQNISSQQKQLIETRDQALEASKIKGQFLATMSHEIRTPMNSVLGMAQLLKKTDLDSRQLHFVETLKQSGNSLLSLISDILDFSKIEEGKVRLETIPFNLHSLLHEIKDQFYSLAIDKKLSISVNASPNLPHSIKGDPYRLRQILYNLIGNAIKFTSSGSIIISAELSDKEGTEYISFSVADTGIGVSPDIIHTLFESFTQADSSTTREFGGTGLGLSIASKIVTLMGGSIHADSVPGFGSVFHFSIPYMPTSAAEEQELEASLYSRSYSTDYDGSQFRLLVAEDEEINRMFITELLEESGFQYIDIAHNGKEVLEKVQNSTYDMVLMDCQMPLMDGYTATREIRQFESLSDRKHRTIIVALTANALSDDRTKCLNAGMDDYLAKPLDEKELSRVFVHWLGARTKAAKKQKVSSESSLSQFLDGKDYDQLQIWIRQQKRRDLYIKFLEILPEKMTGIKTAAENHDMDTLHNMVHGLKGNFEIFKAWKLIDLCKNIEVILKEGSVEGLKEAIKELTSQSDIFADALKEEIENTVLTEQ